MTFSLIRNTAVIAALCLVACGEANVTTGGKKDGGSGGGSGGGAGGGGSDSGVARDAGGVDAGNTGLDGGGSSGADAGGNTGTDAGNTSGDAGLGSDGGVIVTDGGNTGTWDAGPGCNLITQDCATGTSCQPYRETGTGNNKTGCFMFGTQTSGECTTGSVCAAGYMCLGTASYGCLKICAYPNGSSVCPQNTMCQPLGFDPPYAGSGYCRSVP